MGQFMNCSRSPLRIVVWLCTCTLVAVALLPGGGRVQAAPTSATGVEVSASQAVVGSAPGLPDSGDASSTSPPPAITLLDGGDAPTTSPLQPSTTTDVEVGEAMVTPAALMELLPHEKQQHKEQMLKHQEMVERLRLENEKRLWEEREALRLAYALEDSDEEEETTTAEPMKTTQPSTTDVTLPGGKRRRTENPILKKFKISNSRGIMVFRSVPTTPRIFTTRKPRITTQPATTSTTTTTTTSATPSTEAGTTAKEVEDITTMQATPSTTTTTETTAATTTTETTAATTTTETTTTETSTHTTTTQTSGPTTTTETNTTETRPATTTTETSTASTTTETSTASLVKAETTLKPLVSQPPKLNTTTGTPTASSTLDVEKVTSASTSSPELSTSSISLLSIELESPELNSIPSTEEDPVYSEPSNSLTTTDLSEKVSPVAPVNSEEMQNDQPMFDLDDENSLQSVHEPVEDLQKASDALRLAMERDKESLAGDPIDMKSHNAKMLEETHKVREAKVSGGNAGHDGVKITKKKQLVDSHAEGFDVSMGEVNGGEAVPKVLVRSEDKPEKEEKKANVVPLKPVRNGFLGPLIMGEKIYSIGSRPQKPQKLKHEASIESQLRQGRIVEIIPPTTTLAQQEEATTTTATTSLATETPTKATTTAPLPSTMLPIEQPTATRSPEDILSTPSALASTEAATEKDDIEPAAAATTTLEPFASSPTAAAEKFSSTVFQVAEGFSSTTRLPSTAGNPDSNEPTPLLVNGEQTESRISDIQIEVYDSTVDSIVASTNFKDGDATHQQEVFPMGGGGTTKPPVSMVTQERFTQYVIDRTDTSTPESYLDLSQVTGGVGRPEPAAIEIHINVSEGISSSDTEDLEFSYPQADYNSENYRANQKQNGYSQISLKPFADGGSSPQNYGNPTGGATNSDEILVVEIIDTGENNTDQSSASSENINPVFTFRSGSETEEEPLPKASAGATSTDELFLADVKKDDISGSSYLHPPPPPPVHHRTSVDRDSDTIFYISNTEVKVGESLPPGAEQEQQRRSQLESQFFPVNYVASTHPNAGKGDPEGEVPQHRYEEDIILSPLRNTADSLKIFRSEADVVGEDNAAPPPDVTYVGESIMEVEQLPSPGMTAAGGMSITATQQQQQQQSDVIIQPGIVPEMSIGVPVIGELPPQIELKEIDFMPDEANQLRSAGYESNSIDAAMPISGGGNNNGNNDDSVQYGGDLIDLGASSSFDGAEGAYPFGDGSEYAGLHYVHSHGGSHLRRDELTADIGGSGETNDTLKEALANGTLATGNDTSAGPLAERRINTSTTDASDQMSNGTDAVLSEKGEKDWKHTVGFTIGLFFVLTPVVVTVSMACALRYLYYKYHGNSPDSTEANDNEAGNHNAGANGRTGESTQPPSPSPSEGDGGKEPSQQLNPNTNSNSLGKPSNNDFINLETIDEKSNDAHTDNSQTESKSNADSVGTLGAAAGLCGGDYVASQRAHQQKQQQHKLKQHLTLLTTSVHGGACGVGAGGGGGGGGSRGRGGASGGGPNGSVTKMTLKNNHLIVETEERNDISRDARETKMTYNGNDKDSIFVVEVSRGIDSKAIPESPCSENGDHRFPGLESKTRSSPPLKDLAKEAADVGPIPKHQQVEVHPPPPDVESGDKVRSLQKIAEVEEEHHQHDAEPALERNCKTGLSQSDLSSTSSTDSNKRYSYGNQELYVIEPAGYDASQPAAFTTAAVHVSGEAQRDDDHKSENGHSLGFCPEQKNEGDEVSEKKKEVSEADKKMGTEGEQAQEDIEKMEVAQSVAPAEVASNEAHPEAAAVEPSLESDPIEEPPIEAVASEPPVESGPIEEPPIEAAPIEPSVGEPQIEAAKIEPQTEAPQGEAQNESTQSAAPLETTQNESPTEAVNGKIATEMDLSAVDIIPPPLEEPQPPAEPAGEPAAKESVALSAAKEADADDSEPSTEANVTEAGIPPITTEMPEDTPSLAVPDFVRDLHSNGHNGHDPEAVESDADEADNAMDSIISLPDPPSTEEIKQFNGEDGDQTSLLDTNQLDSLPPPPPPLADEPVDDSPLEGGQLNGYDMEMTIPAPASFDNASAATTTTETTTRNPTIDESAAAATNGNCIGQEQMNGHDDNCNDAKNAARSKEQIAAPEAVQVIKLLESLPPPTANGGGDIVEAAVDNGNCNGKMMAAATPLTPPASPTTQSPPPKTQLQYTTTAAATTTPLCQPLLPVAVDVNGS